MELSLKIPFFSGFASFFHNVVSFSNLAVAVQHKLKINDVKFLKIKKVKVRRKRMRGGGGGGGEGGGGG